MQELLGNRILVASLSAWFVAQSLKFLGTLLFYRRVDLTRLVGAGGMPSAHSALVTAMALATGRTTGFGSPLFAVAVILASIVMYDATGVRQAVGSQAEVLNRIVDDLYHGGSIREERLRELLGHTQVEVLAGSMLGIAFALLLS